MKILTPIHGWADIVLGFCGALVLLYPSHVHGQAVVREALSSFPADTCQLGYLNLAQLRTLPEYPQIRQRLLSRQLRDFQEFLRSVGTDPETDVDEVVLAWRGEATGSLGFLGIAEGRFQPDRVRQSFTQYRLPVREHAGLELYAFGSGEDTADLFFCFLSTTSAAFGRRQDLKALLDVRAGTHPALDSNSAFVSWEAELEGTAPQWGIATGKAAASYAATWLAAGEKLSVDPSVLLSPVQAVLYRIEWGSRLTAQVSILCQSSETAAALTQLLTMWRDSRQAAPAAVATLLQSLEVHTSGSRVELTASGPVEALDQILRGAASGPVP